MGAGAPLAAAVLLLAGCAGFASVGGVGVGIGAPRECRADGRFGWGATEPCPFDTPAFAPAPVELRAEPVAAGVWVLRGIDGEATAANRGWVANIGVIVGPSGVVLVDTGTSRAQVEAALAAVARLSPLPVVMAVVTHQAPEFVFGAGALRERGIPLVTHARAAELIGQRCETCLNKLRDALGMREMSDTEVTVPERTIAGDATITVGGREIELIDLSQSRGTGDIAVLDRATGVLFAAGLASAGRLPELRDGEIDGWLAALGRLGARQPPVVVPGFGPPGGVERLTDTARYLTGLDSAVRAALALDTSLVQAMNGAVTVSGFESWAGQTTIGAQNLQKRWMALEAAAADGPEPASQKKNPDR
ncbi:MBL fold metallo-hydrolase [Derxia gummosa]|uniref:MBL fold metallo-hydrolase n=1 Tax=Derxia gummosa DSM 723 TaxID=1121388 RepID=A0A8B6X8M3_9BURK|nr:MBL fold metallo-hydrolase [Derxia gummosa]